MKAIDNLTQEDLKSLMKLDKGTHTKVQCECGEGHLVVRVGFDKFLGCSCYPKCKQTYKLEYATPLSQAIAYGIHGVAKTYWRDTEMYELEDELDEMFPSGIHCAADM